MIFYNFYAQYIGHEMDQEIIQPKVIRENQGVLFLPFKMVKKNNNNKHTHHTSIIIMLNEKKNTVTGKIWF